MPSEPRTEAGKAMLNRVVLLATIAGPDRFNVTRDEFRREQSDAILAIEAEARAALLDELWYAVDDMTSYHPHEAPYVGGDASLPCHPQQCAGGMKRQILALLDDHKKGAAR